MQDKVLAYTISISVVIHVAVLAVIGLHSFSRPAEAKEMELIRVDVVEFPDEPELVEIKEPEIIQPEQVEPEPETVQPVPKPAADDKPSKSVSSKPPVPKTIVKKPVETRVDSPVYSEKAVDAASDNPPGNPGGDINLGSTSEHGQNLGGSGSTPAGWVPGAKDGTGAGSGSGPGTGTPVPDPDAVEGPGTKPAPPPPAPVYVNVKICSESGMLSGPNCEKAIVRSFKEGDEPRSKCTSCKPKHVSTLADRKTPELISGSKVPKYPKSARDRGVEGSVTVEYTINTEGKVVGVKITSSSGNADLDQAASVTVKSRRYKPAVQAGIPRNYKKRETFRFSLN